MWFTYIIENAKGQLYTGITTDIERRWHEHCSGKKGARFFHSASPKALLWLEPQPDRSAASRREAAIKKLNRAAKLELVSQASPLALPNLPSPELIRSTQA
ncbi:GIY-YIG nuclease family protein [Gilvimarinus sp. SDUM040013]|uniref:GIY-YIG nuclease family protein n=1 Tax=Gilvimarinus gilvus TaxID=3058038 RepID=A0ABU4RYZ4_9GAMM|nr:GIY-YIG nuclease family protein [Gilvimarinus sp. SDUM040013]MDO3385746.1 GIY-YIG nuclease family protein [Gilvimarinus sp. SDUM040013]MDX6849386.1 GIY-YIG nuclease family protein [Gilvimarinus sp. SDUM040013]